VKNSPQTSFPSLRLLFWGKLLGAQRHPIKLSAGCGSLMILSRCFFIKITLAVWGCHGRSSQWQFFLSLDQLNVIARSAAQRRGNPINLPRYFLLRSRELLEIATVVPRNDGWFF